MTQIIHLAKSIGCRFWIWAGIIALLLTYGICHHLYLMGWPSKDVLISTLDSDVYIRLTKVRELMADGNLYNHSVVATNAPYGGIDTPWTRPLDFILIALAQFTPSDMPIEKRLLLVSNWYPLIIMGLIIWGSLKAAETGLKSTIKFAVLAVCVAGYALITPTYEYFIAGNADHHSLQALLWCISLWLILEKPTMRRAACLGLTMGLWTWISPESLFYVFTIIAVIGFMAIQKPSYSFFPLVASLALTFVTIFGLMFEMPSSQILSTHSYDTLSIVYVTLFSFCAAGFFILHRWISKIPDKNYRFKITAGTVVALCLSFLVVFPKFVKGPMADVEPYVLTGFLTRIWEATPILSTGASIYLPNIYLPIVALLLSIRFFNKAPVLLPLMLIAIDINLLQLRGFYYLEILSMIVIAKYLPTYIYAIRRKYHIQHLLLNPLGVMIALHLVIAGTLQLIPASKVFAPIEVQNCNSLAFQTVQNGALVKVLGNAPLNMESNIMGNSGIAFFTPYHYVAGFYHREGIGLEVKDKMMESPTLDSVRTLLKERQIKALFICPSPIKDAWVNQYFNGNPLPKLDWVTINTDLEFPPEHIQTTKPLILMVNP